VTSKPNVACASQSRSGKEKIGSNLSSSPNTIIFSCSAVISCLAVLFHNSHPAAQAILFMQFFAKDCTLTHIIIAIASSHRGRLQWPKAVVASQPQLPRPLLPKTLFLYRRKRTHNLLEIQKEEKLGVQDNRMAEII
jgi:hypothetical protein